MSDHNRIQPETYEVDAERVAAALLEKLRLIRIGRAAIAAAEQAAAEPPDEPNRLRGDCSRRGSEHPAGNRKRAA